MAKLTRKQLDEKIKVAFLERVSGFLSESEDVLRVGSNELAIPVLDENNEERWLVVTFKVPTGTRQGEEYDGYSMQEDYEMKLAEKARKAEEKTKKAAKDKAKREAAKKEAEG